MASRIELSGPTFELDIRVRPNPPNIARIRKLRFLLETVDRRPWRIGSECRSTGELPHLDLRSRTIPSAGLPM
jgi:hypothetical protein